MKKEKDKYDLAVEYLTNNPKDIRVSWGYPSINPGGLLFSKVSDYKGGLYNGRVKNSYIGCLTQIRQVDNCVAQTDELTIQIKADERIPSSLESIKVEDLPVFAEWQRKIDIVLDRK